MRAIYEAEAISSLVRLLDKDPVSLACQSALILSKMTGHWASCKAIRAEALGPLIRLLRREIGDDFVKAVAHTVAQSTSGVEYLEGNEIPRDTLQQLIGLLGHGRMEVRLAAAEVISCLSKFQNFRPYLRERSTILDLCRLMLDCRDLSEQEVVAAAIDTIRVYQHFDPEVNEIINRKILPPLIRLLDDTCPETAISACRVLRKPMISGDNDAILQRLTPLLSHTHDEIFVEAAWTASVLTWYDPPGPLPNSFTSTTIQRLARLLHHREERVVVSALRSISDARCLDVLWTDILLEMADEGGVCHLIDLLKSRNLAVAESALLVIDRIHQSSSSPVRRHFLKHGIIESLVQTHASYSSRLFQQILCTLRDFFCWRTTQSAIPHLVPCLLSLDRLSRERMVDALSDMLYDDGCSFHGTEDDITPLDPSIPRHLLRLAWHTLDSCESPSDITYIICWFIDNYSQSREEFRAAGAASFFEDSRTLFGLSGIYSSDIRRALRLLGEDVDTGTDSDSSD